MKLKRILMGVLMVVILVTSAGCGTSIYKESPEDVLQKAMEKEIDVRTSETQLDIQMGLSMDGATAPDLQQAMMMGMLEDMNIKMRIISDLEAGEAAVYAKAQVAGMNVDVDFIMTEEVLMTRIPLLAMVLQEPKLNDGYIVLHLDAFFDQMGAMTGEDVAELKSSFQESTDLFRNPEKTAAVSQAGLELLLDSFEKDAIKNTGKTSITIDGKAMDVTAVTMTIGEQEMVALAHALVAFYEKEEMRDLMFQLTTDIEREAFEEEMDEMVEDMREGVALFLEHVMPLIRHDESSIELVIHVDKDYHVRRTAFDSKLVIEPEEGERLTVDMAVTADAVHINQPVTIDMPQLTEENSIDAIDLFFQLMFAF